MKVSRLIMAVTISMVFIVPLAVAQKTGTSTLSPETRALLIQEMQAIDAAMDRIHTALVTGDHGTVASEARHVHDSFVLAQSLSDQQRAEIAELPKGFLAADRTFHQLAANLAEAGTREDSETQRIHFQEMTKACLDCHARFAKDRFPGLVQ